MQERVLVTGGCGFIGSHIVDKLCELKYEVGVLDINMLTPKEPAINYVSKSAFYFACDIRKPHLVEHIFGEFRPHFVIHCAALARIQPSFENPAETYQTNVMGTLNLLEASRRFGVEKFVFSSSSSVYGGRTKMPLTEDMESRPLNPYADSKLMAEMLVSRYAKNFSVPGCSLRYFNVYGPRQPSEGQYATVLGIFLRQWQNGRPFTVVPDGCQRRDFTWVSDVVWANIYAMCINEIGQGKVINIGSGLSYSIWEVIRFIDEREDYPFRFVDKRPGEARETLADISEANIMLNWKPSVSLKQGIEMLKKDMQK